MNIHDTKIISCSICGKCIGEMNFDASIAHPRCGRCEQADADGHLFTISH